MEEINEKTNVINWFEIPVLDSERAKRFYETIVCNRLILPEK